MKKRELRNAMLFAGNLGGNIVSISPDGEVNWELGMRGEMKEGRDLMRYVHDTDEIRLEGEIYAVMTTGTRMQAQSAFDKVESGANPDFRPTNYTEAEVRLRRLLSDVQAQSNSLEKRKQSFLKANDKLKGDNLKKEDKTETKLEVVEVVDILTDESTEIPVKKKAEE
ncbi:hypothetical protein [Roseobacter litoralis]|uniref:hypothetical protein n=1 Tax=Roseobacter litoralis TaxID=42443 RepID=UPI002494704D|nr:hypothetical protein [Roseobacter litoralis]